MELEHHFTVPASLEETWAAFNDPERVAPCFPGATLTSAEGDQFTGSVKIKLGPIALQYAGTGTYVERDESARRAVIEAKGRDKRGNGTANATVTAQLAPHGDGTAVDVTTDLAITGKPAQFGRGVIQEVSDKLLRQFVDCLQTRLGAEATAEPAPAASSAEPVVAEAPVSEAAAREPVVAEPGAPEPAFAGVAPSAQASGPSTSAQASGPSTSTQASGPSTSAQASGPSISASSGELNLMATVAPVLLRRYAPVLAAGLAGLLLGLRWGLRLRRRPAEPR